MDFSGRDRHLLKNMTKAYGCFQSDRAYRFL
jgi:hypothetical protein